jgi:5'-nucleotidase
MRILLTNDDGIFAKGIEAMYSALAAEHDVEVVAPETERSAVGHAITFLDPLLVKTIKRNGDFFGSALSGTPSDCVKLAIRELMKPPPDVVVSGINMGANLGENVIYSGTVSAATEAAMMGVPSIAVSIDSFDKTDFSSATQVTLRLLSLIQQRGLPPGVSLNVNVPDLPPQSIRGVRITRQGSLKYIEGYDKRIDPRNRVYYWLCGTKPEPDLDPATDAFAVANSYISVTPIHYDLTHYATLETLDQWDL